MASKLKIWCGYSHFEGKQCRILVFARTKKRIVELVDEHCGPFTMGFMNTYWSETGNPAEIELVQSAVGGGAGEGVWATDDSRGPRPYRRLT